MSRHPLTRQPAKVKRVGGPPRVSAAAARAAAAAALAVLSLAVAAPAFAHGDEGSVPARESVLQAIAYVVNTPDNMDMITDKLKDAKDSTDQAGVNIPEVEQAMKALDTQNMPLVRTLLEQSIGAKVDLTGLDVRHVLQVPPGLSAVSLSTGQQPGTTVVTDEMPGRGPLSGGQAALLGIAAVAALGGTLLGIRYRPEHSIHALRRQASHTLGG